MFSARGVHASLQGLFPHERGVIDPFWVLRRGVGGDNQVSECKPIVSSQSVANQERRRVKGLISKKVNINQ